MIRKNDFAYSSECPTEGLLKQLTGKWKPQIIRLATQHPVRFNALLRQLPGSSKQSLAVALKELEESGILLKKIVALKPLHVEYTLSEKGRSMTIVFRSLDSLLPL